MLGEPPARFLVEVAELGEGQDKAVHCLLELGGILGEVWTSATAFHKKFREYEWVPRAQRRDHSVDVALSGSWMLIHQSSFP